MTKYLKTTPTIISSKNHEKICLESVGENKFRVVDKATGSPIILELAPSTKQLCDGFIAFALKQPEQGKPMTLSIKLEGEDGDVAIDFFEQLASCFQTITQQEIQPLIYRAKNAAGKIDSTKAPTFTTRIRYFGDGSNLQGLFCYTKNEPVKKPLQELRHNFVGVFYISVDTITKANSGKWYLNTNLEKCVLYKNNFELGTDYL